jgi:hypothetical protein
MATIQLDIPEEDRERFARQAKREGKTLDAWLISVSPLEECRSGFLRDLSRRWYFAVHLSHWTGPG